MSDWGDSDDLDDSLDDALRRGDLAECARLGMRQSQRFYQVAKPSLTRALRFAEFALDAWLSHRRGRYSLVEPFELELRLLLGKLSYLREEYAQAETHLSFVLDLAPGGLVSSLLTGEASWLMALVRRARRDPSRALAHAWAALAAYPETTDSNMLARLYTGVADIALDALEQRAAPQHMEDIASSYVSRAITSAYDSGDPSTVGMARLADARYARIVRHSDEGLWIIEDVRREAVGRRDMGLIAQARTAEGFHLASRGMGIAAARSFRAAIVAAKDSEALVLTGPARRNLLIREEFGIS